MIYVLIAVIICWGATLAFLFVQNNAHWTSIYTLINRSHIERSEMLDRLMARDFSQFKQAVVLEKQMEHMYRQQEELPEDFDDLSEVGM